jgi:hypothetical protein
MPGLLPDAPFGDSGVRMSDLRQGRYSVRVSVTAEAALRNNPGAWYGGNAMDNSEPSDLRLEERTTRPLDAAATLENRLGIITPIDPR